jgi:hypothetical protein
MNKMGTSKIVAAAALAASVFVSSVAIAAPAASTQGLAQQADSNSNVQTVREWRHGGGHGGWRGRHHRGGGWGWGAAAATGLLLGGALAADAYDDDGDYNEGYAYSGGGYGGGGVARCEATFRSFDPGSGTYMGYDGVRHTCPYL